MFSTIALLICLTLTSVQSFNQQSKLFFVENKGQWHEDARFLAQSPGVDAWLTANGITYDFYKFQQSTILPQEAVNPDLNDTYKNMDRIGNVVKMQFINSLNSPKVQGVDKKKGYYNFFIGNDKSKWASRIGLYKEAMMAGLYKGIDARLYYENNNLRYDMIVAPKADPNLIKMSFSGTDKVYINYKGNLTINTSIGDVEQSGLYAYQEINGKKVEVECTFKIIDETTVGFNIGDYDDTYPLIIDPLIYCTFVAPTTSGSTLYEGRVNTTQNVLFTGGTGSLIYPVTEGAYQEANAGSTDIFVTKLEADGTDLIFSTYIGGSGAESGLGCAYDNLENVYVCGYGGSTNIPVTDSAFQTVNAGSNDINVFKLSADGTELLYGTYLGGTLGEMAYTIDVDASYNAYVIGYTPSLDYPVTEGAFQTVHGGGTQDVIVTKIAPDGESLVYSTYIGGTLADQTYGNRVTPDGYCFVAGQTVSTDFPVTEGAFQTTYGGGIWDAFLLKLNQDGSDLVFSTYIGGELDDWGMRPDFDAEGNAYMAGYTQSLAYPTTPNSFQPTHAGGGFDAFVTKFNPTGTELIYSTFIGGIGVDYARGLAVDSEGWAVFGGRTTSTDYPVTADAQQAAYAGGADDAIVTMINPNGTNLQYSSYFGGTGSEYARGIDYDEAGNAFPVGYAGSADFPVTPGAYQDSIGIVNGNNAWAARFELDAIISTPIPLAPPNHSIFLELTPTIEWVPVENAVSYDFQLSAQNNFDSTSLVYNVTGLTETTFNIEEELDESVKYYWHVRAYDSESNVSTWSIRWDFTTEGPLFEPVLIEPANNAISQLTSVTFKWNEVLLADRYHLQVSATEDFSVLTIDVTQTVRTYASVGLSTNTNYYWRVMGLNDYVDGPWSDIWTFKTGNFVIVGTETNYDTDYYNYVSPSPYSNCYTHSRIYFLYTADEITEAGAYPGNINALGFNIAMLNAGCQPHLEGQYRIRMKLTNRTYLENIWEYDDWTTVWEPDSAWSAQLGWNMHQFDEPFFWDGTSSILVETCHNHQSGAIPNPQQYWTRTDFQSLQYRVNNESVYLPYCDTLEFTGWGGTKTDRANIQFDFAELYIMPPNPISPMNNELGVSVNPTFTWSTPENAVTYQIQVSESPIFDPVLVNAEGLVDPQYQIVGDILNETTRYYWHVRAFTEDAEESYWSYKWSFITEGPIEVPVLSEPVNELVYAPTLPVFYWSEVFAATEYNIQVSEFEDFSTLVIDELVDVTTFTASTDLEFNTTFYWRVMAYNPYVNSEWSTVWQFTTGNFATFGNETTYIPSGSNPPGPYGNVWGGVKNQVLITRDELVAAGALPGEMNALLLNVFAVNGCDPLQNFSIKMKHTNVEEITAWEYEGFTDVYSNALYVPVPGWNLHEFSNPFVWNGGSNILIDFCFNNMTYSENASVYYSTTPKVQDISYWNDGDPNVCNAPGVSGLLTTRPNIKLNMEFQDFKPPMLTYPAHRQLGIPQQPNFQWQPVDGAVSYELVISLMDDFSIPEFTYNGITETNYEMDGTDLLELTTFYYWRIRAYDEDANPSNWSYRYWFITNGPLEVPVQTNPLSGMTEVPTIPTFVWLPVTAATLYRVQVSTEPDFSGNIVIDATSPTTSLTGYGTQPSTLFYWRVKAMNPFTESEWSTAWDFTTAAQLIVGSGTSTNLYYYDYPCIYGPYYQSVKHQVLVKADEIIAAGGSPGGTITELGLHVALLDGAGPLNGYTIKIQQTTLTALSGWVSSGTWTQVFSVASFQPAVGWNLHVFDTPFPWNGTSNLLIEFCFNNNGGPNTRNVRMSNTPTSYTSVVYNQVYTSTSTTYCSDATSSYSSSVNRPNMQFAIEGGPTLLERPTLVSPAFAATEVSLTPELSWNAVPDADTYTVQVSNNAAFSSFVVNTTTTETNYLLTTNLNYNTTYYWRVKAANDEGNFSLFSPARYFTTFVPPPLGQVVLVEPANGMTDAEVEDLPFVWNSVADATYYTFQITDDETFTNILFSQDFEVTSLLVTGFDYLTTYYWRVMAKNDLGNSGPWSEIWSFTTQEELFPQDLMVASGWNMVSSYINPAELDMYDVFADVIPNINLVKNGAGQMFAPQFEINNIGNWNYEDGYLVNSDSDITLTIEGYPIIPEITPLFIEQGWNLISYLRTSELAPNEALSTLATNLTLAKNNVGGVYFPTWGINTMGNMLPGEGYFIYMNNLGMLIYPANSGLRQYAEVNTTPNAQFLIPTVKNTGNNATLLLTVSGIEDGNEIGIYNINGDLIGSGAVYNGVAAVTIWGDNEITPNIDGAGTNELLSAKLYNPNSNLEQDISLSMISDLTSGMELSNLLYNQNSIFVAKATAYNDALTGMNIKNVPNPASANTVFEFTLASEGDAEILVYSLTGELVARLANGTYNAGNHRVNFNVANLTSGVYNVVLRSGSQRAATMMLIEK